MGLFLVWCHRLICIVLSLCKHSCKEVCDIKQGIDPYPLLARSCDRWWPDFVTFTACKRLILIMILILIMEALCATLAPGDKWSEVKRLIFGLKRGKMAQCVSDRRKDLFKRKKDFGVMGTFINLYFSCLYFSFSFQTIWQLHVAR